MSGTGGAPKYGVVAQLPMSGDIENPLAPRGVTRSADDEAELGYYKSSLANGITVELSATHKAGMIRHNFPENTTQANVLVDVSHVLNSYRGQGLGQSFLGGGISVETSESDEVVRYTGSGSYDNVSTTSPIPISETWPAMAGCAN